MFIFSFCLEAKRKNEPKSGLRAKAEAILLDKISKLGFQPNKINVGVETPTYDRRVVNNDRSLRKGLYIPSPVFLMLILRIEKLPSPKGRGGRGVNARRCP